MSGKLAIALYLGQYDLDLAFCPNEKCIASVISKFYCSLNIWLLQFLLCFTLRPDCFANTAHIEHRERNRHLIGPTPSASATDLVKPKFYIYYRISYHSLPVFSLMSAILLSAIFSVWTLGTNFSLAIAVNFTARWSLVCHFLLEMQAVYLKCTCCLRPRSTCFCKQFLGFRFFPRDMFYFC